ncbi:NXPE family member 3-like [Diadema setosum]|uniref:NXPE family member 3-like n=1 Tax=Diadema setosum TaxID=31175 RepID=UPI003B3B860E
MGITKTFSAAFISIMVAMVVTMILTGPYLRTKQTDVIIIAPFDGFRRTVNNGTNVVESLKVRAHGETFAGQRTVPHPFCPGRNVSSRSMHTEEYDHPQKTSWQNASDITSGTFSSFTVRRKHDKFRVCDELELVIQARDGLNRTKSYGGDYFRARIFTKNKTFAASSSTDGEVIDYGNGTYSAHFTLKWAGVVNFEVTLVHPSEAIDVLRRIRAEGFIDAAYLGGFRAKGSSKEVSTLCHTTLPDKLGPLCNFTDEKSGFPWFCQKPQNLSCAYYFGHRGRNGNEVWNLTAFNEPHSILPFSKAEVPISGDMTSITVMTVGYEPGNSSVVHSGALSRLPPCQPSALGSQAEVAGFYWGKYWHSGICKIRQFSTEQAMSCLRNKTVYLLGDSTIRQLFQFYVAAFKLKSNTTKKMPSSYIGPMALLPNKHQLDILFRFHGNPVAKASRWQVKECIDYVVNVLDAIKSDEKDRVIVLSLWAHFASHSPKLYEDRLRAILDALQRLRERNPRTLVLFKGANTREHKEVFHYMRNSDWLSRDLNRRLKKMISKNSHVGFMDAWDMTNAQFNKHLVHPAEPHVLNLSNQMLSYVCPE